MRKKSGDEESGEFFGNLESRIVLLKPKKTEPANGAGSPHAISAIKKLLIGFKLSPLKQKPIGTKPGGGLKKIKIGFSGKCAGTILSLASGKTMLNASACLR